MAIYALMGGKVNRDKLRNQIEARLLKMTSSACPRVLFCPFAVKDEQKAYLKFEAMMKGLNCSLNVIYKDDIKDFEKALLDTDILYVGGGVSDDLIAIFKEFHLDDILIAY